MDKPILFTSGMSVNVPTQIWYCESEDQIELIPESTPVGSLVGILTNNGLTVKMKNSDGNFIKV